MNTTKPKGDILADKIEQWLEGPKGISDLKAILDEYRNPRTLGRSVNGFTLGPGQEWHRQDWTEDMLPEGWRPMLPNEAHQDGDEYRRVGSLGEWFILVGKYYAPSGTYTNFFLRTRRPLPSFLTPEQIAEGWVEWHGGDCPVWGGSVVKYMTKAGIFTTPYQADKLRWDHSGEAGDIIAYCPDPLEAVKKAHAEGKVIQFRDKGSNQKWVDATATNPAFYNASLEFRIKPTPVMVPLGPEDVPPGSVVRRIGKNNWLACLSTSHACLYALTDGDMGSLAFDFLREHYEINRQDGKGWVRCEKEAI